jgi:hypothetical protein
MRALALIARAAAHAANTSNAKLKRLPVPCTCTAWGMARRRTGRSQQRWRIRSATLHRNCSSGYKRRQRVLMRSHGANK